MTIGGRLAIKNKSPSISKRPNLSKDNSSKADRQDAGSAMSTDDAGQK